MHPPGADTVLVRHGEIGVKSEQVRQRMEGRLHDNLQSMLAARDVPASVDRQRNRLYVRTDATSDPGPQDGSADGSLSGVEAATRAATDVFGVVSASPALAVEPTMAAITDALAETARVHYREGSFAVRARRAGPPEAHGFSSKELQEEGGRAAWEAVEFDPAVDLDDPDCTLFVEARPEEAYVFLEKREGPGGLPLGTQAPVVALVSGGIDSPVAAWRTMKRGCPIVPAYVDLGEYGGPDHRARALATIEDLARFAPGQDMRARVIPAGDVVDRLAEEVGETRMLALRRFMVRAAEGLARQEGATGIVTGESIGQKSSQTATNLAVTAAATDLPIHRPLLTADKTAITEQARRIDTYEEATIPAGCNRVAPSFPETRATLEEVRAAEPDDLFESAAAAADAVEYVPVRTGDGPSR